MKARASLGRVCSDFEPVAQASSLKARNWQTRPSALILMSGKWFQILQRQAYLLADVWKVVSDFTKKFFFQEIKLEDRGTC